MTQKIPDALTPIVDSGQSIVSIPWFRFFASFLEKPPAIKPVALTASPFAFVSNARGTLLITGGVLTAITLKRGRATVTLLTSPGFVPVSIGDTVTVTYTGPPTLNFIEA